MEASEAAEKRFEADRAAIQTQYDQLLGQHEEMSAERQRALADRQAALLAFDQEKAWAADLALMVADLQRQVADLDTALHTTQVASQSEIQKLQSDLVAANRLIEAKDVAVLQLREQRDEAKARFEAERDMAEHERLRNITAAKQAQDTISEQRSGLAVLTAQKDDLAVRLNEAITQAAQATADVINLRVACQACEGRLATAVREVEAGRLAVEAARADAKSAGSWRRN